MGCYKEDGSDLSGLRHTLIQLPCRPLKDMVDALTAHGCKISYEEGEGCPPVKIESIGLPSGTITMSATVSSQYVSGILLAAPIAQGPVTLQVCVHVYLCVCACARACISVCACNDVRDCLRVTVCVMACVRFEYSFRYVYTNTILSILFVV